MKCVIVNEALKDIEPMTWEFVLHCACGSKLQLTEACLLSEPPQRP